MLRVALGILFFYSIGSLAQLNIDQLAQEAHGLTQANETDKIPLLVSLILGVCIGGDRATDAAGPSGHERIAITELPRRLRHGGTIA
jgi:hypothetical protein